MYPNTSCTANQQHRHPWRQSEFASIRLRLLKVAGRFVETESRIRAAALKHDAVLSIESIQRT
jgi:hypothetical protein